MILTQVVTDILQRTGNGVIDCMKRTSNSRQLFLMSLMRSLVCVTLLDKSGWSRGWSKAMWIIEAIKMVTLMR